MSHEEAFQALKDGDFRIAIPLLEHAMRDAGYSSDALNHAYTLALYRAGEKTRLANAAFEIGDSLVETDPATAIDYFQRALLGGLDAACVRHICDIFEQWAVPRQKSTPARRARRITRVAHVIGCLSEDYPPARQLRMLVTSLRACGIESQVFTTEWAASWFFNPTVTVQSKSPQMVDSAVIGSVRGSFMQRAETIASAIRGSGAQAAFYHASFAEQITTRVASLRPVPIQVNVAYDDEIPAALFDGYIHLTKHAFDTHRRSEPCEWIPASSDVADRLRVLPPNMRQLMALDSAETVSSTFDDLRHASDPRFLEMLTRTLNAFPNHFHVFAGAGDVKNIRAHLHAEGVLPRVRFMNAMSDAESIMAVTDVYLSPFDGSNPACLLDAMGAGKPVVMLECEDLPGIPQLVARNAMEYGQLVAGLLRDAKHRARCSELVLKRFRAEYDPSLLGKRYMDFLMRLLSQPAGRKPSARAKRPTPRKRR